MQHGAVEEGLTRVIGVDGEPDRRDDRFRHGRDAIPASVGAAQQGLATEIAASVPLLRNGSSQLERAGR